MSKGWRCARCPCAVCGCRCLFRFAGFWLCRWRGFQSSFCVHVTRVEIPIHVFDCFQCRMISPLGSTRSRFLDTYPRPTPQSFDALDSREKTIAILGNRWWPQTAKQDGDKICRRFLRSVWKKRNEHLAVGGVSVSRNGAPSQKGCVVNGQTTKASNK